MTVQFKQGTKEGQQLAQWWQGLNDDRGARAELKRCRSASEVMMTPAFVQLSRRFGEVVGSERLAVIVGLLAHLKENDTSRSLPQQMATGKGGGPVVSELRFRRLLRMERHDLYPALIRILRILKGRANLYDLADSVSRWNDGVRKRWAYEYFPLVPEKKTA